MQLKTEPNTLASQLDRLEGGLYPVDVNSEKYNKLDDWYKVQKLEYSKSNLQWPIEQGRRTDQANFPYRNRALTDIEDSL